VESQKKLKKQFLEEEANVLRHKCQNLDKRQVEDLRVPKKKKLVFQEYRMRQERSEDEDEEEEKY